MALDQIDIDELEKGSEMSFLDHLEAFRWHLIRSILAVLIIAVVVFLAKKFIFEVLLLGPTKESFVTYRFLCEYINVCFQPSKLTMITRTLGEQFIVHMISSFWLGLIIAFPYILWEFWRFIKPGLYPSEQKSSRGFVFICTLLFYFGVSFGYFVISPFAVSFLGLYTVDPSIENTVTLSSYMSYLVMFCLPTGIIFEMPVVIYLLAKIGIVDAPFLKKYRRYAYVLTFILGALLTPPDVISQLLIAIPLIILYEISIQITKRVRKKDKD